MEIPLELTAGPRQRDFLDYLNSALRGRMTHHTGSAGASPDGSYFTEVTGAFPVDQSHVELTWRLRKTPDGTLTSLSIEAVDSSAESQSWQKAAYEFATSVLTATLADRRVKFFHRSFFFYIGPQLDGEYWLPGFRFAPVFPEDDQPYLLNAERVVSIDQEVLAIDDMQAHSIAEESSRRHAARLSLLLNVGLRQPDHSMRWVLPAADGTMATQSERYQTVFIRPETTLTIMPEKAARCPLGAYAGTLAARYRVAGELQSLPLEARKILRGVDQTAPEITDAFDRGSRLYQVALVCGQQFPSVGLAYRVAAVEAMSAADATCNGFSEFMRKYVNSVNDIDPFLGYLYGHARSGHFHAGAFPVGEFSRAYYFDPLMDMEWIERDSINRTCHEITREAIVNWMQSVVPTEPA